MAAKEVRALIEQAWDTAPQLPVGKKPPTTVIQSISAKQRPRRPSKSAAATKT